MMLSKNKRTLSKKTREKYQNLSEIQEKKRNTKTPVC